LRFDFGRVCAERRANAFSFDTLAVVVAVSAVDRHDADRHTHTD